MVCPPQLWTWKPPRELLLPPLLWFWNLGALLRAANPPDHQSKGRVLLFLSNMIMSICTWFSLFVDTGIRINTAESGIKYQPSRDLFFFFF